MASKPSDKYDGPKYEGRNFERFEEHFEAFLHDENIFDTKSRIRFFIKYSDIEKKPSARL
jgi:hypothetical protein